MPNRLASETSPYLRQHAGNPVDWYPWGGEALERARREDRPILLSIGYSACHWCHVMAHECFEDPEVAAEMNRLFVNVKVDREERPDLDQIYQAAQAMLTQRSGGWPLTMFLAPDGTPFFGGTYFPKRARHGLPGLLDLMPQVAAAYREHRGEIVRQNDALLAAMARTLPAPRAAELRREPLAAALTELAGLYDAEHGGFGRAPKFPHPYELAYCLRRAVVDGSGPGREIVERSLVAMAEGGLYDQLAGGFCRYSVDAQWSVPHFEKMLYDNAALLALYTDAWRVTGRPLFERTARGVAGWVLSEMQPPQPAGGAADAAGYYSSLDADSEHEEGKYYLWTPQTARALLTEAEYAVLAPHYALDAPPNFEHRAWHLRVASPLESVAGRLGLPLAQCEALLESARGKLLAVRGARVRPGRDEKVLTSWNALMIEGMARAARVFGVPAWLASARRALDFVRRVLWVPEGRSGRLLATYKDGTAHLNAYLDDHAFLIEALLEMMQAEFRPDDLAFARQLADILIERFEDPADGGFYFVSHDHEPLFHRAKPGPDNATPSGNGVAARALQRLGHLVGETRYLDAAGRALRLFYPMLERQPSAMVSLATALEEHLDAPQVVVLRGASRECRDWQQALARTYRPDTLVIGVAREATGLPPALDRPVPATGVHAWVCRNLTCLPPLAERTALESVLAGPAR